MSTNPETSSYKQWKELLDASIQYTSWLIERADRAYKAFQQETLPNTSNKGNKVDEQIAGATKIVGAKILTLDTKQKNDKLADLTKESMKAQYLQEAFKSIQEKNSFLLGAPKDFSDVRTSDLLSHLRNFPDDAKYFLLSQNGQAVEDRGHSQEAVGQKMIVNDSKKT